MAQAISLAANTRPHPNPRVGALLVDDSGKVIAEATHDGPGRPHAEAAVIEQAGPRARGATIVVTLEPCVHHGRTLPCTDVLIEAGVARVVVGAVDPDDRVSGRGLARLRQAGIEIVDGVLAEMVEAADPGYFQHRRSGRPRVVLKAALTLDGQVAAADGSSRWITSPEARADGHRLRAAADAVVVGAGTLLTDDPRLTVRIHGHGPQPVPVVIAGKRSLPPDAAVFARKALVYAPRPAELPAEVVVLPGPGGVDLDAALADLGARGHLDILVEGGPTLSGSLLRGGLVDRCIFFVGSLIGGGTGRAVFDGVFDTLGAAVTGHIDDVQRIGPDVRVEFVVGMQSE